MVKTGNLFLIAILIFFSTILLGCTSSNVQSPPFSTSQFVSRATDLNYSNWLNGDYNNMVLVFDGNKISVADANDLNVALPDLLPYVPYQGATSDVNLGLWDLTSGKITATGNGSSSTTNTLELYNSNNQLMSFLRDDSRFKIGRSADTTPVNTLEIAGNVNFDAVAEPVEGTFTVALAGAGAGNVDNGVHYYAVAFVTDQGVTGNYTVTKNVTVVDKTLDGKVNLTNIPVSTDPRVTSRRIYRSKAGGGNFLVYYLATISNNTATTYTDNIADSSLTTTDQIFRKANTTAGLFFVEGNPILKASSVFVTAVGLDALGDNTLGHSTVAVGGSAMQLNTTGVNGTCIGYSCMSSNTSGGSNVGVGYSSIQGNKTGSANTAVGTFALRSDTANEFSYNTAMGYYSLYDMNVTNTQNSAFGGYAGSNFNGNGNLLLGYNAGYLPAKVGDLNYNIMIGYNAGGSAESGATENILIGKDLDLKTLGGSRQLQIGNYFEGDVNGLRINKDINVGATEKVVNGSFLTSDAGWTHGVAWAYDSVNKEMDKNSNSAGSLGQEIFVKKGDYLRASFEVRNMTVPLFNLRIGTQVVASISADGNYLYDFTADQDGLLYFVPANTSRFSLTNISVQKIGTTTTNYLNVTNDGKVGSDFNVGRDLRVDGNVYLKVPYGTYTSMNTQTVADTSAKYYMDFNTTEDVFMINKYGDTNFGVDVAGDYELHISIIGKSSSAGTRLNVWVEKNGVAVPRSNTPYNFKGVNSIAIISVPFILDLNETDRFSIMYSADSTNVFLPALPATTTPPAPETPSAIMIIKKIGEDMS